MGRVLLILLVALAIVAFAAFVVSIISEAASAGRRAMRPVTGSDDGGKGVPKQLRTAAVVALIVLLFGVSTGWLGGL